MSYDCTQCSRRFNSQHAQWQHKANKNHFDHECSRCYNTYETEQSRKTHEVEYHNFCADCDRQFMNYNNIQQHLRSAAHLGGSITCPFCKRGFTTATGLVHHIESSACPNAAGLDRDAVYRIVRQKDPSGVISKKLIGWTGSESFQATARAWNPYDCAYECYFCNRAFDRLSSLNQHLRSPAHQQKLYHCPKCPKEFVSLAAIINHFESESCGYTRFSTVQNGIRGLTDGSRLLAFR
ncbi:putative zinc finger protein [Diaporthe ampelina]|uniref:Putative zinc finger protein n=1 Tax=Diaporthe ampelina TaxID=1214573 RepID=A0A0G2F4Y1_9PEZI|nr:putative zinc finger protein [Diaporthe ampelina]